jgi:deoxyribonuclease-4
MSLFGAHIRSEVDVIEMIKDTKKITDNGGTVIQLFTNKFSKKAIKKYSLFKKYLTENNIKCVVHSSYTINIAQNWDYHSWWLKQFILEIRMAKIVGAFGIIVHLGKQLDLSVEVATNNMYTALIHVLSKTEESNLKILIETSSGQGSEMFCNLEELGTFFKKFTKTKFKDRVGICLDTCHVFASGYDIRGPANVLNFIKKINKNFGLVNIKLIHLNDSLNDVNSHVDRHENIGNGFIGKDSLISIANFFYKLGTPLILETPTSDIITDLNKLSKIKI